MPGPIPKPSHLRQRRNREATAATLTLDDHGIEAPELPGDRDWHPRTLAWWEDVWASPMAPEFLEADVHGLFLLAELEDDFHKADSPKVRIELAKEIRLQRQAYGLTPIDRRRLQWEVDRGDEAEARRRKRERRAAPGIRGALGPEDDPRALLGS